jgi:DNA-binding MarR family transcriptional regulator
MRRIGQLMVEEITVRMEATGFPDSPTSFHAFFENVDPEGTRVTVLARRAGMTHQAMGELVATMQRRGYAERVADPTDGRATLIRLTPVGRELLDHAIRLIDEMDAEWDARLRRLGFEGNLRALLDAALRDAVAEGEGQGAPSGRAFGDGVGGPTADPRRR